MISKFYNVDPSKITVDFKGIQKNDTFTWKEHFINFVWGPRIQQLKDKENISDLSKKYLDSLISAMERINDLKDPVEIYIFIITLKESKIYGCATINQV